MLDLDSLAPERIRRITRKEYDQMVEMGLFEDERVELLAGVLVEMTPQGTRHSEVVRRLTNLLVRALAGRADVSPQLPLALSDDSEPEPDLALIPVGTYLADHPDRAYLLIEVADSSLRKDRRIKARLYAAAGMPEYWLVNLQDGVIEVHRDPGPEGYATVAHAGAGDTVAPLAFPDVVLAVGELIPPAG